MSIGKRITELTTTWMGYVKHLDIGKNSEYSVKKRVSAYRKVAKLNDQRNELCVELDKLFEEEFDK